jgi:hypothetical protein
MNNKPSASYQLRRPTLLTVEVIQLVEQMQIQQLEVSQTIITIKAQSVPHIKPHMLSSLEEYHKDRATAPLLDWTSTSPKLQQLLAKKPLWTLWARSTLSLIMGRISKAEDLNNNHLVKLAPTKKPRLWI